jgi:hypothetical protein
MGKKIKIRGLDKHPGSYIRELRNNFWVKILEFFDEDPDKKNSDPGSRIRNTDSKYLLFLIGFFKKC